MEIILLLQKELSLVFVNMEAKVSVEIVGFYGRLIIDDSLC